MTPEHTAADAQVGEARSAIYEVLAALPARDAGRLRSLISELEGAVESAALLRRMADEAQPSTEAHKPEHTWAAELHDPVADEWVPGTRYNDRNRAVKHLAHARSIGPTWKDGTPVQRRLVRATTTYTVEDPS